MISSTSIPCRYTLVVETYECPSWRWITGSGTPPGRARPRERGGADAGQTCAAHRPPPRSVAAQRARRSLTTVARASVRRSRRTAHRPAARPGRRATERDDRSTPTRPSRPPGGDCPLPRRIRIEPRRGSRSDSISDKASWIRSPPRHSTTISARSRSPCLSAGVWRITATISSTVGGSAGYTRPLFLGACPALWPGIAAGDRRRPAASSNSSEDIAPSLREQTVDQPALQARSRASHCSHPARGSSFWRCRSPGKRQRGTSPPARPVLLKLRSCRAVTTCSCSARKERRRDSAGPPPTRVCRDRRAGRPRREGTGPGSRRHPRGRVSDGPRKRACAPRGCPAAVEVRRTGCV